MNLAASVIVGDSEVEGSVMNLSEQGMFLRTEARTELGASARVTLVVGEERTLCTAEGTVVWRGDFGLGLDLASPSDAFIDFCRRLALVAESPRTKKDMLDSLLYPPQIELGDG